MLMSVRDAGKLDWQSNKIGLCLTCVHSRQIRSDRESVFYFCSLSETDSSFPKYPRLPVLTCPGYTKEEV